MSSPAAASPPTGVLIMAYGTPATPDDIEAYYTHVRRGRPPTTELLDDLRRRYDAIGGTSPLLELTRDQAAGIQAALGDGFRVELGMKHAPPFIEDGVAALAEAGVRHAVGLVLAPHYSALSVGEYAERTERAASAVGTGPTHDTRRHSRLRALLTGCWTRWRPGAGLRRVSSTTEHDDYARVMSNSEGRGVEVLV